MRKLGLGVLVSFGVFGICSFLVGCAGAARSKSAPEAASAPAPYGHAGGAAMSDATGASPISADAPAREAAPTAAAPVLAGRDAAPAAPPAPPPAEAAAPSSAKVASSSVSTPVARPAPKPERALPQSGQLTAGVWDDNANFDFWKPYAAKFTSSHGSDFDMFGLGEQTSTRDQLNGSRRSHTDLDIQLVLDTTGSMGDELSYLQGEFDAIAAQLRAKLPNVTPRWSLVVYRDRGDAYVTRTFDFTTDTAAFRHDLRAQSAGGGGDTPEAVVEGLGAGMRQSWRSGGNVAKIAFWVADAPAHPGEGQALANVIRSARGKGVHVYPVASSDADDAAEYQMRSAAQLTGGRYIFLTNDSGIGNSHAEPHIPCYNVTRLDHALVRMIQVEMGGRYVEAEANQVVRRVGKPDKDGKCQLSSGMLVASY